MIKNYAVDHLISTTPSFDKVTSFNNKEELTLEEQFEILSACPNYHPWATKSVNGVKKHQYFVPLGSSPRNLIIEAIDEDKPNIDLIVNISKLVLANAHHISQVPTTKVAEKKVSI